MNLEELPDGTQSDRLPRSDLYIPGGRTRRPTGLAPSPSPDLRLCDRRDLRQSLHSRTACVRCADPPNRLVAADVFLRQEPDDGEEEEEDEDEDEDEDVGDGKEDDGDDDKDDDGYSEGAPRSDRNGCHRRDV